MKAITCPQCGGLIKNIVPYQPLAECEYCGAKITTDEKPNAFENLEFELAKFRPIVRPVRLKEPKQPIFITFLVIVIVLFAFFVLVFLQSKLRSAVPVAPKTYQSKFTRMLTSINNKSGDTPLKFSSA